MNEIELSGIGRPAGAEKPSISVGRRDASPAPAASGQDTVELSSLPDVSLIEAEVEHDFATKTHGLQGAIANSYPPLETIDRVAAMLAGTLAPNSGESDS